MRVFLKKEMFTDREYVLVETKNMKATAFKYATGVEALKVENSKGYFIILPFKGQQIWRLHFLERDLHMKTMMEEPQQTNEYLHTYGAFLLHCGITGIGSPRQGDTHVQHGEIPSADYQMAYLECNEDYLAVGGRMDYNKTFVQNYSFSPECRLYADDTVLKFHMKLENRRSRPMEYSYLCHINFRPFDGAEILDTSEYKEKHKVGEGEQSIYDPEICFSIRYKDTEEKCGYTLQYTKEGACYVKHPTDILPVGVRWISRTGEEDSMGMILPATAEPNGYNYAKEHGQLKMLGGKESIEFDIEVGYLDAERALEIKEKIETM